MNLLLEAVRDPESMTRLDLGQWDRLLRMARRERLHARLALSLIDGGLAERVPPPVQRHVRAYARIADAHDQGLRWEVDRISDALAPLGRRVVLLKGAAYMMSGMAIARGRLTTDVDILVAKPELGAVEHALLGRGWEHVNTDEYTQHYYRRWMHELPPLRHHRRESLIDVHHTILPETGRLHPDAAELLRAARPLDGHPGLGVLDPLDMVLHSAAHLFQDSLDGGLRDLVDLDDMLRAMPAAEPDFWDRLVARARVLDLMPPLYYTLRFAPMLLRSEVPPAVLAAAAEGASPRGRRWMDRLVPAALTPELPGERPRGVGFKRWLLYVRSHWVRMPPLMLIRHLAIKGFRRLFWSDPKGARG